MKFLSLLLVCNLFISSLFAQSNEKKYELNPKVGASISLIFSVSYGLATIYYSFLDQQLSAALATSLIATGFAYYTKTFYDEAQSKVLPTSQNESLKLKNHAYENGPESTGSFAPQSNRIIPTGQ